MANKFDGIITLRSESLISRDELYCLGKEYALNKLKHALSQHLANKILCDNALELKEIEDDQHNIILELECNLITNERLKQLLEIEKEFNRLLNETT